MGHVVPDQVEAVPVLELGELLCQEADSKPQGVQLAGVQPCAGSVLCFVQYGYSEQSE